MTQVQSAEATVNGVRLRYRMAGSGPTLVLLHGSPQTSYSWRKIIPRLAETYTVVAPDLRGHGESEKPESGYRIHDMVEDVRQLLLQLGTRQINLIGHDLGGIVAYVYAAKYRSDVRRLGIIEAPIFGVPSPTMERVLASYWHMNFYAHPTLPELLISGRERDYFAEFIKTYRFNHDAIGDADFDEYGRHLASPEGIRGVMGVYRTIASEVPDILPLTHTKLTMPVWAVGGEHSMSSGPLEQFQQLSEMVQGGVIAGSGHWVAEEQPEQVLMELMPFLA